MNTHEFAAHHGICTDPNCPPVADDDEAPARSAREVAVRTLILQGVIAGAAGVDSEPLVAWFKDQSLWADVTPSERALLLAADRTEATCRKHQWHMEAQWALLWVVQRVESLGLPTKRCDSRRLVDEIMPPLGSDVSTFINSAAMRPPGEILAEDDRTYDLWCCVHATKHAGAPLPADLNYGVLYERRYAFEWLDGYQEWDEVTCDA